MTETEPQIAPAPPPPPVPKLSGSALLRAEAAPLATLLDRLRKRAARLERLRQLTFGLAAAAGILFLAAALVAFKQAWARDAGWVLAAVALAAFAVRALVFGARTMSDDAAAARALGRVAPHDASDLLSAVELARALSEDATLLSSELVRAHVARMGAVAAALDDRPAISLRPLQIALGSLGIALLAHALLFGLGGNRVKEAYRFLAFRAEAESNALFAPEPIAGDITLTYRYPAHMSRPNRTVAGTAGDISAPKGTVVELSARADRDVERAIAIVGKTDVPLTVKGRELTGTLLVTEPGEWRLRYTKANGKVVAEGPPRPVAIEPDQFPEVKIEKPQAELEIQGKEAITVNFSASDDYGLTQLELVYSLGKGTPEQRKKVAQFTDLSRRQRGDFHWDLSVLDLKPGDRVTYRLEATDNDTVSGPKKGVSATQVLKVFSETEHHREVLQKAEEQWERLVTGLGDRLEEPAPGEKPDAKWESDTAAKDQTLASLALDMRKLAADLAHDKRAPVEIGRALQHVGDRLGASVQRTTMDRHMLVKRPSPPAARHFHETLASEINEEEKGVLYLEDLIDRRKMLDLAELARELQQGRQELTRLIEQYKQAPTPEMKQQILGEIARLKERMADVYKRMRELQKGIQDEHLNTEADQLVQGGQDMMSQLDEVQKQLQNGDTDKALKSLEELQKQLDDMEKKLRNEAGDTDESNKELSRQLQQMASDLVDLQAEQKTLKQKTDELRSKEKQAQKEKLEKLGKEFLEKQKQRVAEAEKELQGVDDRFAEQLGLDEDLQAAKDRTAQLEQALKAGDFDEALEQANQAVAKNDEVKQRLDAEREAARQFPGFGREAPQLEENGNHVDRADKPMREVAEDLDKLMRSARQPPTDAERQQMKDLAQKQQGLEKRAEQLQQQMDQIGKQAPVFGPQQGQLLKDAANQMNDAKGKLGEGDSRGASGRQSDALQKLDALQQAMRQQQQSGSGEGGGVPMPFGNDQGGDDGEQEGDQGDSQHAEKVEIPGADQSKAPAEFREELMKAMKDETPERYKDRVREYYEELVK